MQRHVRHFAWMLILAISATVFSIPMAAEHRGRDHSAQAQDRDRERDRDRDRDRDRSRTQARTASSTRDRDKDRDKDRHDDRHHDDGPNHR